MARLPERYLVWGAGGHGRVVGDLVMAMGETLVGFVDAEPEKVGSAVSPTDYAVTLHEDDLLAAVRRGRFPQGVDACALGVGDNAARQRCLDLLSDLAPPALVHPTASVSPTAGIGRGTVVFPLAVVNSGARIGEGVIINSGAIVEHDCLIGAAAHLSPGAILCGAVTVGDRSWIGAGATVIPGVAIGRDVVVGAGSTVLRDVPDGSTVFGSPAKSRQEES